MFNGSLGKNDITSNLSLTNQFDSAITPKKQALMIFFNIKI